ncbi:hypothetical protein COBT_001165 [Conglomerata obtusa]
MYNRREQDARFINHTQIRSTEFIDILTSRSNIGDLKPVFKRFMSERNTIIENIEDQSSMAINPNEIVLNHQNPPALKLSKVISIIQNVKGYSCCITMQNSGIYLIVFIENKIYIIVILWRLNVICLNIYFEIIIPHEKNQNLYYNCVENGKIYFKALNVLLKFIRTFFNQKEFTYMHLNMIKMVHFILIMIYLQACLPGINSKSCLDLNNNFKCIAYDKKQVYKSEKNDELCSKMHKILVLANDIGVKCKSNFCNKFTSIDCIIVQDYCNRLSEASKLNLKIGKYEIRKFVCCTNQRFFNVENAIKPYNYVTLMHKYNSFVNKHENEINVVRYSFEYDGICHNDEHFDFLVYMPVDLDIIITKHITRSSFDIHISYNIKFFLIENLCKSEILQFLRSLNVFVNIKNVNYNIRLVSLKKYNELLEYQINQFNNRTNKNHMSYLPIEIRPKILSTRFENIYKDDKKSLLTLGYLNVQKEKALKNMVCRGNKLIKLDYVIYTKESIIVNLQYVERIQRLIKFKKHLLPLRSVAYANLSEPLRKDFAIYCCKRIKKMNGGGFFKRLWRKVNYAIMPKTENYYQEQKKIGKSIYDLAEYCAHLAPRMMALFRKMNETEIIQKFAKYIQNDIKFDFDYLLVYHSSAVFIEFFRMCLDGLVPSCLATTILYFREKGILFDLSHEKTRLFWKLLPFTISGEKRKLLKILLEMWEEMEYAYEICHYQPLEIAEMFCPAILPKRLLKKIGDSSDRIKFVDAMFHLNYDLIDTDVYLDYSDNY